MTNANTNKGDTMKTVLESAAFIISFIIVGEIILFTIFGIIPALLKSSL